MNASKILVALDDSPASRQAIEYVSRLAGAGRVSQVVLCHAVGPIPPSLLEHGGGDTPQEEEHKQARLDRKRAAWVDSEERESHHVVEVARAALHRAGLADTDIVENPVSIVNDTDLAQELLAASRRLGCQSIVLARDAFATYREHRASDVADQLKRGATDEMVIVLGEPIERGAPGSESEMLGGA
jgi:hypothetical protein